MKRFMVYFFATDFNRVKIGYCKGNLYSRKRQIQNGCPDPIQLLGVILCEDETDMRRRETELHIQFQEYNTVGEWFRFTSELAEYIQKFTDTQSGKVFLEEDRVHLRKYSQRPEVKERMRKYSPTP